MELADGQGDLVVEDAHAHTIGGTERGENENNTNKVELVASRLAAQVVSRLNTDSKTSKDIQTLAQAIQTLQTDINSLKRKHTDDDGPSPKRGCKENLTAVIENQAPSPPSPVAGTSADSETEDVDEDSDIELEHFIVQEEIQNDKFAELEQYFEEDDGAGEEVGEQIARISERVLRGTKTKKDGEKFQALKDKHKRPRNISNLQAPKVEEFLWGQLSKDLRTVDYYQKKAVTNYGQAMVPLIKALECINGNKQPEKVAELVMDAFKLLSLNIKLTNMNRLERVKKELHAKYVPLCEEGPSATKLLGEHFQEQAKKLESSKQNLTKNATRPFLGKKGGERNYQSFRQSQYNRRQGPPYNNQRQRFNTPANNNSHNKNRLNWGKKNPKLNRK